MAGPFDFNPATLFGGGQQSAQQGYNPQSGIYSPQGGIPSMLLSGGNTPQQKGYGIQQPTWPMAYDTGPGLQPGTPQDVQNSDMNAAGAAETQFATNASRYDQPGALGQWWNQNQSSYQGPGMGEGYARRQLTRYRDGTPGVTQNSQTAYDASLGAAPDVSANLNPYYDNAKRRANEEIMQQMAARGMAGGTPGMDRSAEALTDLNAQQARDEAQYGLDYSADRRAWTGLQGQLAGQADQSSQSGSANELAWTRGLGDLAMSGQNQWTDRMGQAGQLAGAADSADLARMSAGQDAAGQAQRAQYDRLATLFGNQMALGGQLSGGSMDTSNAMFDSDQALQDAQIAMELGLGQEALNQSYRSQERFKDDSQWAMDMMGGAAGMMGGGMGGF